MRLHSVILTDKNYPTEGCRYNFTSGSEASVLARESQKKRESNAQKISS